MLDDRYYRDPNDAEAGPEKTMLGEEQKAWLKEQLLASDATVKFIASGSEWQTHGHIDSWTSFAHERREIFQFIEDHGIEGVILLSGDRHFTAGYQIHGELVEVTAGPMGSGNATTGIVPDTFLKHDDGKMYAVFDVDTTEEPPAVRVEVYRAGDGLLEKKRLSWGVINGEERIDTLEPRPPGDPDAYELTRRGWVRQSDE